jgi:hypothetical protein
LAELATLAFSGAEEFGLSELLDAVRSELLGAVRAELVADALRDWVAAALSGRAESEREEPALRDLPEVALPERRETAGSGSGAAVLSELMGFVLCELRAAVLRELTVVAAAGAFARVFARGTGEPLTGMAERDASKKILNAIRSMKECAEDPEHL